MAEALAIRRPAFVACVRDWLREEPERTFSGRQVNVKLIVKPSGIVDAPSVDDPAINSTTLGACLRNVVSRPFPAFEGEPLQVTVPLRLGE